MCVVIASSACMSCSIQLPARSKIGATLWLSELARLGGAADGTIQIAGQRSHLPAYPLSLASGDAHLAALSQALAAFGGEARLAIDEAAALGDPVTSDVLTEIVRAADQALWKLEAHNEPA
jgi:starvation-inducible DNA-binding protein